MARPKLAIPASARVLEVGSGHNPHPQATVLADRYIEDIERAGRLKIDRPLVIAHGGALPFKDAVFDYVIAIHVAEHMEDIGAFFDELARVAPAGYIETPSAIGERLFGWRKHRWRLIYHEATLYVRPHDGVRSFGTVFHELMRRDAHMTALYYRHPDLFRVRCSWQGSVPYQVLGSEDPDPVDLDDEAVVAQLLEQKPAPLATLRAFAPRSLKDPLWGWWRNRQAKKG